MSNTPGACKLCLRDGMELRKSHFIPAAAYRTVRDDKHPNPNPFELTARGAVQTSRQMTAPLLCDDCEQRFAKNGENWFFRHCLQKSSGFPLASILASARPDVSSSTTTTRIHFASKIPEISVSELAYFAASMFWRGSIHPWNSDGSIPVKLGPFQEPLRQYLIGLADFPTECALGIVLHSGKARFDRLTYGPFGERKGNFHVYKFPMAGIGFGLAVSRNLPANFREMCFVHGSGNPIVVTSIMEEGIEQDIRKLYEKMSARGEPRRQGLPE